MDDDNTSAIYATNSTNASSQGNQDDDGQKSPHELAQEIQNILICLEMLFFSIAHWCVFPAEEWEPGYRRKEFAAPGLGLKDFANDVSFIMASRRRRRLGDLESDLSDNQLDGEQDEEVVVHDSLALQENEEGDDELVEAHRTGNAPYQATLQ